MDFLNLSDAAIKAKNKKELLDFVFKVKESITEEYTMINMLLKLQNDLQELRSEVKELKESHTQSSDNTELEKHIHDLDQYQRRNNIEISGIPKFLRTIWRRKLSRYGIHLDLMKSLKLQIFRRVIV